MEEYLSSSYDPDVEFVDGALVERNVGDCLLLLVQSNVLFSLRRKYPHFKVVAELRSSVTATRYRLLDVCVLTAAQKTRYLLEAAFLVVEVLSNGDVMSAVIQKLREYAGKGVSNIWLIDPHLRSVFVYRSAALIEVQGNSILTIDGSVELSLDEIFAE